jgi:hypothetical protein
MTNTDPRHPTERAADQQLWERIVNTSPSDEVLYSPDAATAEDIATGLWEYGTNDEHDDLDRDATIASLARTLRYEGGAS